MAYPAGPRTARVHAIPVQQAKLLVTPHAILVLVTGAIALVLPPPPTKAYDYLYQTVPAENGKTYVVSFQAAQIIGPAGQFWVVITG